MYNWKFGLPPLSSDRCGALPFRNEISGLNSPWCLRGEDWEFLHNWAVDRYWLVDYTVWIDDHGQMPWPVPDVFPVPTKGPERQLLSTMHYDLSCLSGYWGKDFAWQDCAFDSRNDVEEALRSCLQPIDPLN